MQKNNYVYMYLYTLSFAYVYTVERWDVVIGPWCLDGTEKGLDALTVDFVVLLDKWSFNNLSIGPIGTSAQSLKCLFWRQDCAH